MSLPQLSIIIPVLNEAVTLPACLMMLARQRGVAFEVLICDGGSSDGTDQIVAVLSPTLPYPCRWLAAPRGRGTQMNRGAEAALGSTLLFLHADSDFPDPSALRLALSTLAEAVAHRGNESLAMRFSLRFSGAGLPPLARRFHEAKARLAFPGCIHGDQGFLLRKSWFEALGGFAVSLPYLEDDRLADAIGQSGQWCLTPTEIVTSTRRFATEGWRARQLLNALILTADAIGWDSLLQMLPQLYRPLADSGRLDTAQLLSLVDDALARLPRDEQRRLWYAGAEYARSNAWQLVLWWEVWRGLDSPGRGVARFAQSWQRLTNNVVGRALSWLLVRVGLQLCFWRARRSTGGQG